MEGTKIFYNFTEELCSGEGDILDLKGATPNNIRFAESLSHSDSVQYALEDADGAIKVAGVGVYSAVTNSVTRSDSWNWNGVNIDSNPIGNIPLNPGMHVIRVTPLAENITIWNDTPSNAEFNELKTTVDNKNSGIISVTPQTVSGLLALEGALNQLRDSGAFTIPLANSVVVDTVIFVELPELYGSSTPTVTRTGTDLIRQSTGTDTVINIDGAVSFSLVSNGVDEWALYVFAAEGVAGVDGIDAPTTVIPQTVSGLMTTGGQINQLQDSGAFTLPLANSVSVNTYIVVELPETYKTQTPTLTRTGADLIENDLGTDTSITWTGAARLTLTSDGVSKWRL